MKLVERRRSKLKLSIERARHFILGVGNYRAASDKLRGLVGSENGISFSSPRPRPFPVSEMSTASLARRVMGTGYLPSPLGYTNRKFVSANRPTGEGVVTNDPAPARCHVGSRGAVLIVNQSVLAKSVVEKLDPLSNKALSCSLVIGTGLLRVIEDAGLGRQLPEFGQVAGRRVQRSTKFVTFFGRKVEVSLSCENC